MKLDKSEIDRVEQGIMPPMGLAITLPIVDAAVPGLCVYVCATAFNPALRERKFSDVLETLKSVAANLTL